MIVLRVTLDVLPEKQLEVIQTLLSMIEPAGKEAGCLSYAIFCDIEDQNRFSMLGEWETRENLDHHLMSHRFGALLGAKSLLDAPMQIQIHTISQSEGMEAIAAARSRSLHT
jgi:quinol monooxygenase YgiN